MTRSEAIAVIVDKLSSLEDEALLGLAEHAEDLADAGSMRRLTEVERATLSAAKADFAVGRTSTIEEARAASDRKIADWRKKYPNAP